MEHVVTSKARKQASKPKSRRALLAKKLLVIRREFSVEATRAALVRCWCDASDVSVELFSRRSQTNEFLSLVDADMIGDAIRALQEVFDVWTLKDVECGFEQLMDRDEKRRAGVVYTPDDRHRLFVANGSAAT